MTKQAINIMVSGADDELVPEKFVQSGYEIKQYNRFIPQANESLKKILDKLEKING
jgi:hypothetical protein